ncbi:hypothetical protein [Ferruginibacter sp. HRS2-29]|uniref:hypothetical protein n=1 Tax=Ferruginibacter sp. HRS2-29 TaxID=2487334 RepID=UPI0020CDD2B2|nr:hypothetical protein [Ferruginibacter sp. HRS2-29]
MSISNLKSGKNLLDFREFSPFKYPALSSTLVSITITITTRGKTIHHGRNIKRFREMLGIKQETLALSLNEACPEPAEGT